MRTWHLFTILVLVSCVWLVSHDAQASFLVNAPRALGLNNGLVGWWTFDGKDMAGNYAFDKSGNGNRGLLTGSNGLPVRTIGKLGQAMTFDGVDDYVDAGDPASLEPSGSMSVSLWFKLTSAAPEYAGPLMKSNAVNTGYGIFFTDDVMVGSTKSIAFFVTEYTQNAGYKTFDYTADRNWHHAVGVYDGQNVQMYVDGVKGTDDPFTGAITTDAHSLVIGSTDSSFNNPSSMPGLVDDVRVYNRALSADEIKRLYQIGGTVKLNTTRANDSLSTGLVGWWTFDGKDMAGNSTGGEYAFDKSGNGNRGKLTNGPKRVFGKIGQGMQFDGVDDYVDIADNTSLDFGTGAFSISLWMKADSSNSDSGSEAFPAIIEKGTGDWTNGPDADLGWWFGYRGPGGSVKWAFIMSDNNTSQDKIDFNELRNTGWRHVVVTVDPGTGSNPQIRGYLDGAFYTSTTRTRTSSTDTAVNLNIGQWRENSRNFSGLLDDVRIYNRALSGDEIKRLYNMGR